MKILNTVQELWSHCLFCPICKDMVRDIHVTVGPDGVFDLVKFRKDNHILHLDCKAKIRNKKYLTNYHINCLDNSFEVEVSLTNSHGDLDNKGASTPFFFFFIEGICDKCDCAHSSSMDLEIDLLRKKIVNVGLERESIYLLSEPLKYHITLAYDSSQTIISRCDDLGADTGEPFFTSLLELDFSDPKKIIKKIKTILVFS